jgi:imidazolonepropionase-like amidohydrolase
MSDFATGVYEITVMDEAAETTTKEVEVQVIDGGGGTLTPGFIENHSHLMLMGPSIGAMETSSTWEDFAIHGSRMAEMYLMQGFTTVRDAGGANGGLRRAIDAGQIVGPRLSIRRLPQYERRACRLRDVHESAGLSNEFLTPEHGAGNRRG